LEKNTGKYYEEIQNLKKYFKKIKEEELEQTIHDKRYSFIQENSYYRLKTKMTVKQILNLYKRFNNLFE